MKIYLECIWAVNITITTAVSQPPLLIYWLHHLLQRSVTMKAELQDVMDMLRKLQGAIDFGNAPMAERDELARDVSDIMDALFEVMKNLP